MAQGFMDNVDVSVVGEPMGAALNSYGDATEILYERVHLRLHVSTVYHLSDGFNLREYSPVDLPAPFSFSDWSAGRDPAVDPSCAAMRCAASSRSRSRTAAQRRAARRKSGRSVTTLRLVGAAARDRPASRYAAAGGRRARRGRGRDGDAEHGAASGHLEHLVQPGAGADGGRREGRGRRRAIARLLEVDPDNINRDEIAKAIAEDTSGGAFRLARFDQLRRGRRGGADRPRAVHAGRSGCAASTRPSSTT
jgi:hypothetical protein